MGRSSSMPLSWVSRDAWLIALARFLRTFAQASIAIFFAIYLDRLGYSLTEIGLLITVAAIIGKVAGAGLPALLAGFNRQGGWRIGIGMLPRGEVALIMAGIGISRGIIGADLFGVAIIMTIITTALAPPILALSFRSGVSGVRSQPAPEVE